LFTLVVVDLERYSRFHSPHIHTIYMPGGQSCITSSGRAVVGITRAGLVDAGRRASNLKRLRVFAVSSFEGKDAVSHNNLLVTWVKAANGGAAARISILN
jgi:hypothetical protein